MQMNYNTRQQNGRFAPYDPLERDYWIDRCIHAGSSLKQMVGEVTYLTLVEMYFEDEWTAQRDAQELERLLTFGRDALLAMTECTCATEQPDGRGEACRVCKAVAQLKREGHLPIVSSVHTSIVHEQSQSVTTLDKEIP